jgi:hypothetical protein
LKVLENKLPEVGGADRSDVHRWQRVWQEVGGADIHRWQRVRQEVGGADVHRRQRVRQEVGGADVHRRQRVRQEVGGADVHQRGNRPFVCLKEVSIRRDRSLPTGRVVGHLGTTITPPSLCSAPLVDMTAHLSTTSWAALLALTLGTAFPPLKSCFPRAIFSLVISS